MRFIHRKNRYLEVRVNNYIVGQIKNEVGCFTYRAISNVKLTARELAQISRKCVQLNRKGFLSAA